VRLLCFLLATLGGGPAGGDNVAIGKRRAVVEGHSQRLDRVLGGGGGFGGGAVGSDNVAVKERRSAVGPHGDGRRSG